MSNQSSNQYSTEALRSLLDVLGGQPEYRGVVLDFLGYVDLTTPQVETRAEGVPYLDSVRLEWLFRHISGKEWRRLGIVTSAGMNRTLLNDAMATTEEPATLPGERPAVKAGAES